MSNYDPKEVPSGLAVDGATLIRLERERQIAGEGWSAEHDDAHNAGELALAGASYAIHTAAPLQQQELCRWHLRLAMEGKPPAIWPWSAAWWKPSDPIRNLTKAGALIAAEIDRWLRSKAGGAALRARDGGVGPFPAGPAPESHTPGPWSTGRHRLRKQHVVPALGEWWECSVQVGQENPGNTIAIVYMGGPGATQKDAEAVYANAELIASAPDLLAKVKILELEVALLKSHLAVETAAKEEAQEQRNLLAGAARLLAMLGLQSERYASDPEYRDAVDDALSLAAPSGEEAPR